MSGLGTEWNGYEAYKMLHESKPSVLLRMALSEDTSNVSGGIGVWNRLVTWHACFLCKNAGFSASDPDSCSCIWEPAGDGPSTLVLATIVGDPGEVSGSWLWLDHTLVVAFGSESVDGK